MKGKRILISVGITVALAALATDDAKCGFACHTIVKKQDYVFTVYPKR